MKPKYSKWNIQSLKKLTHIFFGGGGGGEYFTMTYPTIWIQLSSKLLHIFYILLPVHFVFGFKKIDSL